MDYTTDNVAQEHLLQLLSTLLLELNVLQTFVRPGTSLEVARVMDMVGEGLSRVEAMAREALYAARITIDGLSLPEMEQVPLAETLSRMVEETAEHLSISSRISVAGGDEQEKGEGRHLSLQAERLLLLTTREALYQVEQHVDVHRLRLTLNYGVEQVQMSLEDDGMPVTAQMLQSVEAHEDVDSRENLAPPFTAQAVHPRVDVEKQMDTPILDDLRRRIEQMGGVLEIRRREERGTIVQVRLPYEEQRESTEEEEQEEATEFVVETGDREQEETIRIVLVDRQTVSRAGLHRLLETFAGLEVVGEAGDSVQAVSETLELGPQVVLIDAQLPEGQSLEALRQIKELNLGTKVLLLAAHDREEYLYETLRAGADGYVLKDIAPDELAQTIRAVARGDISVQSQVAGRLLARIGKQTRGGRYDTLTTREREVLRLLARGLRNKEIAARLFVSERTVNFHLANIYQKLNVSGRTEAISKALEQGLLTP